ncbi:PREDICTED: uncharacterized protein LOC109462307 [Branchiostoma belcheri]|uniref:Uncharacterized protein LOC109462307 n=1 Tax=Branchiostoma belcheri TaxID=7741 RepID=A0A6P4XCY2_BRABE|nr:PREDICTED: uncharacterized protein LOC109462307 [Branchiostoma belcheri]
MDAFLTWNGTGDENVSATLAPRPAEAAAFSTGEVVLEITAMLLIMVATVVGNAAVCWIVISNPKLRTVSNQLVFNLALCDLLTAVVNGPITVVVLVSEKRWNMGDAMCAINGFTTTMFGLASVLTLAVISLNRFAMIVHPQKAGRWFSVWKLRAMIFGVWAISSLASFPPIVGWSTYQFIQGKAICTIKWSTDVSYTLFILPTFILLPFFVMIACYYKIFKVVKKNSQRIMSHHRRTELNPTTPGSTPSSSKKSWQPVPVRKDSDQSTGTPRVPPTITIDSADSSDAVKDGGGHDSNKPLLPNHILAAKSTETTRRNSKEKFSSQGTAGESENPRNEPTCSTEQKDPLQSSCDNNKSCESEQTSKKTGGDNNVATVSFACKSHSTLTGLALERINEENKGETQGRVRCYSDVSATKKKKPLLRPTLSAKKRDSLDDTDYSTAVELKEIIVTNDIILHNPKLLEDSDDKTAIKTHEQRTENGPKHTNSRKQTIESPMNVKNTAKSDIDIIVTSPSPNSKSNRTKGNHKTTAIIENTASRKSDNTQGRSSSPKSRRFSRPTKNNLKFDCNAKSPRRLSDPFTILTLESKIMKDQSVSQSSLNATMGPVSILRKSSTGSCSGDIESHRRDRLSPRPKEKLSARLSDPEKYNRIRLSIGHVDVERKRSHSLITSTSPSLLRRFQSPSFIRKRQGPGVDDVKVTKILLIVICVFVVCWAPISLVNFVETFFRIQIPPILDITTVYMVFLNCALNPVIYGLMNRNFRDGFKDFFSKCRGKGEHDSSNGKKSRASDGKIV